MNTFNVYNLEDTKVEVWRYKKISVLIRSFYRVLIATVMLMRRIPIYMLLVTVANIITG